jgi:hypothetical protein
MQAFQALSYRDKWRVTRFLTRGDAPDDPRMAAAAVELAESYQRRRRGYSMFIRWLLTITIVVAGVVAIAAAVEGEALRAISTR